MPLGAPFEPQPPAELILEMWQGENEIQKTSELPKIVPPLPTGDTKDLKVWRNYWKQHDEHVRQSEREKSDKIFDHTITLCEALIERFDSQSQLGFNALIIKRDIESLRKVG